MTLSARIAKLAELPDRSGGHNAAGLGDRNSLDNGDVEFAELVGAQHLDRFRQMLIDKHDFAAIDRITQSLVDLERQAASQHTRFGQRAIDVMTERRASHQRDAQAACLPGEPARRVRPARLSRRLRA